MKLTKKNFQHRKKEARIEMISIKFVLNQIRLLSSASSILLSLILLYGMSIGKTSIDAKSLLTAFLALFGGIILVSTSWEDIFKIFKNKYSTWVYIKQIIFLFLWISGLLMGVIMLIVMLLFLYVLFK
ncbi:MAG: hypothetical protein O8C64_04240 [Candidatus Methanoperedens sp.]|nr:hypothetical protein [Candidatus Methanoperedens sp.]MCZ7403731.1 hypothetical protein [Candidatus Methanoperedens sp.]